MARHVAAKAAPKAAAKTAAKASGKAAGKATGKSKQADKANAQATAKTASQPASAAPLPVPTTLAPWCARLAGQVPSLQAMQCQSAGLNAGDGRSVRGVPLWVHDAAAPGKAPPRFKVLAIGGIHGDEFAAVALIFDWIARTRAQPTAGVAWRLAPLVNPDGLLQTPSTRVNARGVDLNRNFPTADWGRDAQPYWVQRTRRDPRRFPGPQAMSEPETRWVQQQIEQFRPDLIVSVHAPYGLLDFDGPPPVPHRLGNLQLDPVGVYPGSLGNYGGLVKKVPVMTLELKNSRQVSKAELDAMWSDLQRWIDQRVVVASSAARPMVPSPVPTRR